MITHRKRREVWLTISHTVLGTVGRRADSTRSRTRAAMRPRGSQQLVRSGLMTRGGQVVSGERVLRAGVVGCGSMGRHHLRVLSGLDGVELVGACDPDPRRDLADYGIPVFDDPSHLIERGLDMCVVAAPTREHHRLGLTLARAGVPTLIEKPLAATAEDAREMNRAFASASLLGCVGHIERYSPAIRGLRGLVDRGEIGKVLQITTSRQGPFTQRITDVGVVLDLASHDIDLARWIAGSPYHSVTAALSRVISPDREDLAATVGALADGTVVNHLVNWLSPLKERVVTVTGTGGCLKADLLSSDLWFLPRAFAVDGVGPGPDDPRLRPGLMIPCPVVTYEPLRAELEAFRDAVLGIGTDVVSLAEGCEVLDVAEAMLTRRPSRLRAAESRDRGTPEVVGGHQDLSGRGLLVPSSPLPPSPSVPQPSVPHAAGVVDDLSG